MANAILAGLSAIFLSMPAWAQVVEVPDDSSTGQQKAQEYFKDRKEQAPPTKTWRSPAQDGGATPRYLALHVGSFFTSNGYKWGDGDQEDIGKLNAGVTYRVGEWVNSMDLAFRFDYTNFELDEGNARKLTFGGIITFPDSNSRFPLYFGGGLGLGIFMKQIDGESAMSLDWSLLAGARFLDVIDNVGFFVESGMKNALHLIDDGQFNGVFFSVGTVFAF
jgi:hypothetical protein